MNFKIKKNKLADLLYTEEMANLYQHCLKKESKGTGEVSNSFPLKKKKKETERAIAGLCISKGTFILVDTF